MGERGKADDMKNRRTNLEAVEPEMAKTASDKPESQDAMGTQANVTKPHVRLGREVQAKIGQQLRAMLGLPISQPIAFTTRTLGFLAQPFYPPGIDGTAPGPLYNIQANLFQQPTSPNCQPYGTDTSTTKGDGVTLFPGSVPLYKGGVLVGGLGISGDGVDQDDFVSNSGTLGYTPGPVPTADHFSFRGTPLPYLKFPRQPTLF